MAPVHPLETYLSSLNGVTNQSVILRPNLNTCTCSRSSFTCLVLNLHSSFLSHSTTSSSNAHTYLLSISLSLLPFHFHLSPPFPRALCPFSDSVFPANTCTHLIPNVHSRLCPNIQSGGLHGPFRVQRSTDSGHHNRLLPGRVLVLQRVAPL